MGRDDSRSRGDPDVRGDGDDDAGEAVSASGGQVPRHLPVAGEDIASGTFLDAKCEVCKGKHFNKSPQQMLLCDLCDQGFDRLGRCID